MSNAKHILRRFNHDRRGVVALIFALSLLPLTMLVGLSIDYSFYAQAKAQFSLAGDAAATYAVREATATYALESQANATTAGTYANPTTDAKTAGQDAGNNWFATQLATLPTSTVLGGEATTNTAGLTTTVNNVNCSGQTGGFNATVNYNGVYPPFFDYLFGSSKNWYVSGTSVACTSYTYDEVLLMLDTSGSMLTAANPSDVTAMDDQTACIETYPVQKILFNNLYGTAPGGIEYPGITAGGYYGGDSTDSVNFNNVANYVSGGVSTNTAGTCTTANSGIIYNGTTGDKTVNGVPNSPCAFACHTTTTTASDGYTQDYYGMARRLNPNHLSSAAGGVTLRIDALFQAAENVIQDMQSSQQVAGQYTVGVYQFNDNTSPIVDGGASDPTTEATSNLANALSAVEADDWLKTPTETAVPMLAINPNYTNQSIDADEDFTDFAGSMSELLSGKMTNGTSGSSPVNLSPSSTPSGDGATNGTKNNAVTLTALAAAGDGTSTTVQANGTGGPLKTLIIVTDGLDDTNPGVIYQNTNASYRNQGPMTSITAEAAKTGTCAQFKALGFTIYILYVDFNAIPIATFYWPFHAAASTSYLAADYGGATNGLVHTYGSTTGGDIENWTLGNALNNTYAPTYPVVSYPDSNLSTIPDYAALQACAGSRSSTTANVGNYFYEASSSTLIAQAMNSILSSAINGAIRISQ